MPPAKSGWQLIDTDDSTKTCISIRLDSTLVEQLQQAIVENRAVRRAERQADAECEHLYSRDISLNCDIRRLDRQIEKLTCQGASADCKKLLSSQRKLLAAQREYERIAGRRRAIGVEGQNRCSEQSVNVDTVLRAFEEILVDNHVIHPEPDSTYDDSAASASESSRTSLFYKGSGLILPAEPSVIGRRDSSGGSDTLSVSNEDEELEELIGYYGAMREKLQITQDLVDRREEYLDRGRERRKCKIAAGEVESQLDFDLHQLQQLQRWTRKVIEAEAEVEEAKKAVIAAGIYVLGSEVAPGLDDVNDGYQFSDEAVEAMIDRAMIQRWLDMLPDPQGYSCADRVPLSSEDSRDRWTNVVKRPEVDDWDARSVELCESYSTAADGRYRKRIDEWRRMCAQR